MPKTPINNLPPESQPWARDVDRRLRDLELSLEGASQGVKNSFKSLNSSMSLLSSQVARIQETNVLATSSQAVPYSGGGTQYTVTKPKWANYALIVSGTALTSKTINGDARIELMHDSRPITSFSDYHASLSIGVGSFDGDFVPQSFPYLVDMSSSNTLYTRPWTISLGASSGTVTATFITNVQWLQV